MSIRLILSALVVFSASFPFAATAQNQITTGVIQGSVADATGASLPGVTVEARNLDTNQSRTLVTETDGRFVFLQLSPGNYRVTFTLSGFATPVQENVQLTVGQAITLPVAMKVSGVSETVTVTTATRVIETSRTAAATTLNQNTIDTIPILGRKFEDLLTLTPGVAIVQGADGDEISFAGQRGIFNNISLDGGDYNNGFFGEQAGGQRASIDITLDAIKEFQVIATGAPAEFGRTAGGVVNVITKSGTNATQGQPLLLSAAGGVDGRSVRRVEARRVSPRAVRRHARWPNQERQGVLLSGGGRDQRQLRTAEPEPSARRRALPGAEPDAAAERGADQHDPRLPADGAPRILPVAVEPERRRPHRPSTADDRPSSARST